MFCISLIGIASFSDGCFTTSGTGGIFSDPEQSDKVGITVFMTNDRLRQLKICPDENKNFQESGPVNGGDNRLVSDQFELQCGNYINLDQEYLQYEKTMTESLPGTSWRLDFRYSVWIKVPQMEWKWAAM